MKLSLVLIIYRSNSSKALEASKFCEEAFKNKNIKSYRIESDFNIEEIEKMSLNSRSDGYKYENNNNQTLKIYTDGNFSKNELAKLKWAKGHNKVEIIMNNQLLKIPGQFDITKEMLNQMKNLNGVKKIDFAE